MGSGPPPQAVVEGALDARTRPTTLNPSVSTLRAIRSRPAVGPPIAPEEAEDARLRLELWRQCERRDAIIACKREREAQDLDAFCAGRR